MKRYHILAAGTFLLATAFIATNEAAIHFLWRYIAGPLVTHATGSTVTYNGVVASEGYNIYNTSLYAASLVGFVVLLDRLLDRWDIRADQGFVISMIPFVVFGGLLRVVEDTGAVGFPFNMALITPVIYFLIATVAIGSLGLSIWIADRWRDTAYTQVLARTGLIWVGGALLLLASTFVQRFGQGVAPPPGILYVVVIAGMAVLVATGLRRYLAGYVPDSFLASRVGEAAVIAQVMDGAVTAGSISLLGYGEKHVVSRYVIETFGTPYGFLAVKAAVIFGMLAYLPRDDDRFSMLVLLGVIAVGMGPAVRNLVRAILGI